MTTTKAEVRSAKGQTQDQHLHVITDLLGQAVSATDKIEGLGARLAVAVYSAVTVEELDETQLRDYAAGTSKAQAQSILEGLCGKLSPKYEQAMLLIAEKDIVKEEKDKARRQVRAVKQMLSRAVIIAVWLKDSKVTSVAVRNGDIRLTSDDDEMDGRYSVRSAEQAARKHLGRTGTPREASHEEKPVTMTVKSAAEWLANQVRGTDATEFSPATRKQLVDLMTCLGYVFAPDEEQGVDGNKVVELAKKAANG